MFAGPIPSRRSVDGGWTSALERAAVEPISPDAALTAAIDETKGLSPAPRVGIEAGPLDPLARRVMRAVRPRSALVDCTNLLRLARIVKTADEISLLREAAGIAEVAAADGLAALADSGRVSDAVDRFHLSLVAEGAIPDHFTFGADGMCLSTDVGARLSMNVPFFVDFGCVYRRYCSDAGLTAVRGR